MKEISVFIRTDDLTQVTEIPRKHNAGGISFYEVNGAGRTTVNPFDEPRITSSIKRTGRSKVIVAGVNTAVCICFSKEEIS